jgi:hypothetical protein
MRLKFNDVKGIDTQTGAIVQVGETMNKRQQLKIILERGSLNRCNIETYVICNGKRTLRSVEATDAPIDFEINIYCNDIKQLELQNNKYNIKK